MNLSKAQFSIESLEDVKHSEKVVGVSSKYTEIKTSELLKNSKLKLVHGVGSRSAHYVVLNTGDIKTVIENSYDGSRAFRIHFEFNGVNFGYFRQVHRGEELKKYDLYKNIAEYSTKASAALEFLKKVKIEENEKRILFETAFEAREVKIQRLLTSYKNLSDNYFEFLKELFDIIENGSFLVKTNTKAGVRKGRKILNNFRMFDIQNKVWKKIEEINFEYFI